MGSVKRSGPRPKPESRVELTCPICGKIFWRYASQVRWRGARYCSKMCHQQGQASKAKPRRCRWCNKEFLRDADVMAAGNRGRYCSRACYLDHLDAKGRGPTNITCAGCGVTVRRIRAEVERSNRRRAYCSRECMHAHRVGENHHAFRGEHLPRRGKVWRDLAERIRERDGRRCVRCGTPEAEGKAGRLNVDHVVPARMLLDRPKVADDPTNLASLCTSCHATKTHQYEPRILRGDWLAIEEFYGREMRLAVTALVNAA